MTTNPSNNNSEKEDMQYKISINGFNLEDILKEEFIKKMETDFDNFQSLFFGLVIGDLKKENMVLFKRWENNLDIESYKKENIRKIKTLIDSFKDEE
ncbi:MAG: hypothetical protein FWH29_10235 [Methanobrevibacter sp.]|nr:hypothetical protein [Methanobrevibacter sp.]